MSSDVPHGRPLEKSITDRTMLPQDEHHSMVGGAGSPNNLGTNGSSPLGRQISIQLTPHQFEQLYLQPGGFGASRQEDLTKRFANPTVYGLAVFVLSLTPASTFFMGWMGTDTSSLTVIAGPFLFLAGIGLWTAGILEWILGNTFPFVVFASFSGLYLSLGYILSPNTNIGSTLGAGSSQYNNALAMYFIFWALMTFIFLIISLRTNVVFVFLFFTLFMFFALAAAAFNRVGSGNLSSASRLFTAAGAFVFACCMSAWLLFLATMLASNNFPLQIPLGDLSHFLETPKEKRNRAEAEQRTMAAGAAR